jgi:acyl dehydratase
MPAHKIEGPEQLKSLVGKEAGVSDWCEITQARINQFADATEDHQWIHIDEARAASDSPYRSTIAHGFLTLSLLPKMLQQAVELTGFGMKINYGLNKLRFPAPVPVGSRIRARFTITAVTDFEGGVQITWRVMVEAAGQAKPCLAADWLTRAYY